MPKVSFLTHFRFIAAAAALRGVSTSRDVRAELFGVVARIEASILNHRPDGSLAGVTPAVLEEAAGWVYEAGALWSALVGSGLLMADTDGVYWWRGWAENRPASVANAERQRRYRAKGSGVTPRDVTRDVTRDARDVTRDVTVTLLSRIERERERESERECAAATAAAHYAGACGARADGTPPSPPSSSPPPGRGVAPVAAAENGRGGPGRSQRPRGGPGVGGEQENSTAGVSTLSDLEPHARLSAAQAVGVRSPDAAARMAAVWSCDEIRAVADLFGDSSDKGADVVATFGARRSFARKIAEGVSRIVAERERDRAGFASWLSGAASAPDRIAPYVAAAKRFAALPEGRRLELAGRMRVALADSGYWGDPLPPWSADFASALRPLLEAEGLMPGF